MTRLTPGRLERHQRGSHKPDDARSSRAPAIFPNVLLAVLLALANVLAWGALALLVTP